MLLNNKLDIKIDIWCTVTTTVTVTFNRSEVKPFAAKLAVAFEKVTWRLLNRLSWAIARFFCNGSFFASAEATSLVGGPPGNFQIWRLRNVIFSTCHEICLRKIDLEYENGKQLQVTIIKITESKENKSIQKIDVSVAQQIRGRGQLPPLPPPPR